MAALTAAGGGRRAPPRAGFRRCSARVNAGKRQVRVKEEGKGARLLGYMRLCGSVPGGQAEYPRVPHADFGPIKVPENSFPRLMERLAAAIVDAVAVGERPVERGPGNVSEPREELDDPRGGRRARRRHRLAGPLVAAGAAARELVGR